MNGLTAEPGFSIVEYGRPEGQPEKEGRRLRLAMSSSDSSSDSSSSDDKKKKKKKKKEDKKVSSVSIGEDIFQ